MKKQLLLFLFFAYTASIKAQTIPIYWTSTHNDTTIGSFFHPKDTVLLNTANDLKLNLSKATGLTYDIIQMPDTTPTSGILLLADTNYSSAHNQNCEITCNGTNSLVFKAKYYLGVNYGVYEYLNEMGFRFYLPDTLWEVIPNIASPFNYSSTVKQPVMSIRSPAITGGIEKHPIDSTAQSKKDWYKWLDRTNIKSEYELAGHNDWDANIRAQMLAIQCSWAEHDSSMAVNQGNVPNVTNSLAMDTWGRWMAGNWKFVQDYWFNDPWVNNTRSIDLPDGSRYGNTNYFGCANGEYGTASEQRFTLQNRVTEIMQDTFPGTDTWCFSYEAAADTPSVQIHDKLNVSVTMGYQFETSDISLVNRWKKKMPVSRLSEYNYLNLPFYGQYPYTNLKYFKNAYNRISAWGTQGNFIETGISKFSTGINLYAFNEYAKNLKDIDLTRQEFMNDMFGSSAPAMIELFDLWNNTDAFTNGAYIGDNKQRFPKYLQLIQTASAGSSGNVKKRIDEIKAYIHYLVLNDRFMASDTVSRLANAEILATYIASLTSTNILNSYASIFFLANDIKLLGLTDTAFYWKWEPDQNHNQWGTTGNYDPVWNTISPITEMDIDANFQQDLLDFPVYTSNYTFNDLNTIVNQISTNGLESKDTINFSISNNAYKWSYGFTIYAPSGGSIKIIYDSLAFNASLPLLNHPSNDDVVMNFSIDSDDQLYSDEKKIHSAEGINGQFDLLIPAGGRYQFLIQKSTYGGANLKIVTNGNIVCREGAIYPTVFEKYPSINEAASYVYVPQGHDKIYFSLGDVCTKIECMSDSAYNLISEYKTPTDSSILIQRSATDSSLYFIDVPTGMDGKFWKIYNKTGNNFGMSLATISNYYFWLQPANPNKIKKIKAFDFSVYPNPNNGSFQIAYNATGKVSVKVYNSLGQVRYNKTYTDWKSNENIRLNDLTAGIYFVTIEHNDETSTQKVSIIK